MDVQWLIHIVLVLIIVGMIAGLLYYLVQRAPFIADPIKPIILWVIIAICVIFVIYDILLPLIGGGGSTSTVWQHHR
jgi:hypothetical protein